MGVGFHEWAEKRGEKVGSEDIGASDGKGPDELVFEFVELAFGFFGELEDVFGVSQEFFSGLGQSRAASVSQKQCGFEILFELLEGDAEGGLADVECFGCSGHAAVFGDAEKVA
jgi:hypothetical protein